MLPRLQCTITSIRFSSLRQRPNRHISPPFAHPHSVVPSLASPSHLRPIPLVLFYDFISLDDQESQDTWSSRSILPFTQRHNGNPEALFCAGSRVISASERARARALRRHVHKCIYTYNYIDCIADEFADCTIYDYIGSIKRNENARTTCHTRVTPRFSPSIRSSLSVVDLRYLEDSLQSIKRNSRSKRFREKR